MKTLFTIFTLALFSTFALAQDAGTLDVTWNKTGIKIFDVLPNESDNALAVAEQDDGKLLVAGSINDNGDVEGYVARFHPNGTLDSTFHYDGVVAIDMSNEDWDYFVDMKIRPDGKILVAAETMTGGNKDIMLVQFMPDGSLDPNFGNLGIVKKDLGDDATDETAGLLLQPDGKCVVYGNNGGGTSTAYAYVIRFTANGGMDNSFGASGIFKWDETGLAHLMDGVLLPSGKMVFAGYESTGGETRATLIGLTATGDLDPGFGNGGKLSPGLTSSQDDAFTALALNADNTKLVAGGITDDDMSINLLIARFSISGGGDPQFGNGGFTEIDLSKGSDDGLNAMTIQPDGKILLAGQAFGGTQSYIARLDTDGELETDFNNSGAWMQDISPANEEGMFDLLIDQNGKAVSCGTMEKAGNFSPFLVRLNLGTISTGMGLTKAAEQPLEIYPNPARDAVTIRVTEQGQYQYEVLDMRGALVAQGSFTAYSEDHLTVNTSNWVPGSYLVRMSDAENVYTATVMKH